MNKSNDTLKEAEALLHKYYGYSHFRIGQERIVHHMLQGVDTLGILPTGFGKSICYQIPALLYSGLTLVISPLISLMKDQVDALRTAGVSSACIHSSLTNQQVNDCIHAARMGTLKLLYVAPERLQSQRFVEAMKQLSISCVAVDEAHCVSQWGHDFRTSYLIISSFVQQLPTRPIMAAFTATATPKVIQDIVQLLQLREPYTFIGSLARKNLCFRVLHGENKLKYVLDYVQSHHRQCGIIYASTRKEVEQLYERFRAAGVAARRYHAGLTDEERFSSQDAFLYDDKGVMIATNAFGMGIDKSNVRYVIHYNMPKNMEAYVQEAGRAGRDSERSECILLFAPQDVVTQKFLIEQHTVDEQRKRHDYQKLQHMVDYCYTTTCLSAVQLAYFEQVHEQDCCGICSNCEDDRALINHTIQAQKIFCCIHRMQGRYGARMVASVLKGSRNKKVLDYGFHHFSTYGSMKEYTECQISDLIHTLISERYLLVSTGPYPLVQLHPIAAQVLKGEREVWLREARLGNKRALFPTPKSASDASKRRSFSMDEAIFEQLRLIRKQFAEKEHVPSYIIFNDATLREMSVVCPQTHSQMLTIKGVGEVKFAKYGQVFLQFFRSQMNSIHKE